MDRRTFLTMPLALLLAPAIGAAAEVSSRKGSYAADVGLLYRLLSFHVTGTVNETVDGAAQRYDVHIEGDGSGIANRIESSGVVRAGRWAPVRSASWFNVHGRESRTEVRYDYERRLIEYHARAETFILRRVRSVDDTVPLPAGAHVDDVMSAVLNYGDGRWAPDSDGMYRTQVIRRHRGPHEGPDDVADRYHAEIVPLDLRIVADPATGKPTALFDLTQFSSWAYEDRPARIVFGADRRPELITTSMILGSSVTIHLSGV